MNISFNNSIKINVIYYIRSKKELLDQGIEKAKWILTNMFKHVQASLDMRQVILAGPFYYLIIQEVDIYPML